MANTEATMDELLTAWRKEFPNSSVIVILGGGERFTLYALNGTSDLAFSAALTLLRAVVTQSSCDCEKCAKKLAMIENFIKTIDPEVAVH